jgi:hypothetical protein
MAMATVHMAIWHSLPFEIGLRIATRIRDAVWNSTTVGDPQIYLSRLKWRPTIHSVGDISCGMIPGYWFRQGLYIFQAEEYSIPHDNDHLAALSATRTQAGRTLLPSP